MTSHILRMISPALLPLTLLLALGGPSASAQQPIPDVYVPGTADPTDNGHHSCVQAIRDTFPGSCLGVNSSTPNLTAACRQACHNCCDDREPGPAHTLFFESFCRCFVDGFVGGVGGGNGGAGPTGALLGCAQGITEVHLEMIGQAFGDWFISAINDAMSLKRASPTDLLIDLATAFTDGFCTAYADNAWEVWKEENCKPECNLRYEVAEPDPAPDPCGGENQTQKLGGLINLFPDLSDLPLTTFYDGSTVTAPSPPPLGPAGPPDFGPSPVTGPLALIPLPGDPVPPRDCFGPCCEAEGGPGGAGQGGGHQQQCYFSGVTVPCSIVPTLMLLF